ncbi:hypothetical protein ACT7C1_08165 [Bacillus paranthracis]
MVHEDVSKQVDSPTKQEKQSIKKEKKLSAAERIEQIKQQTKKAAAFTKPTACLFTQQKY